MLGHQLHNDRQDGAGSDDDPRVARRKRELEQGQQQARDDMLRDLGIH